MEEYAYENGQPVDLTALRCYYLSDRIYKPAHKGLVISCHDVIVAYEGKILLVERKLCPAKNLFWPIGGRLKKGVHTYESLRKKVRAECNLEITDIKDAGYARTFFRTDPFGHGKGTDSVNLKFFAQGKGKLKGDKNNTPILIDRDEYQTMTISLHPYVKKFMEDVLSFT